MTTSRDQDSPCSLLLSLCLGLLASIFWGLHVNHLVSTAHSSYSSEHWIQQARTKAYGLCYNGCGDSCIYPSVIADACHMTTRVDLSGSNILCDARKIWFWAERYPLPCLEAVGEIYKADALWWKRFWLRGLYTLVPVFGIVAFFATFCLIECVIACVPRPQIRVRNGDVGIRAPLLRNTAVVALVLVALITPAAAYPCPYYYPPYNRYFANENGTKYGVIHGWLSDCYIETYTCGETCTTSPANNQPTCSPISCTRTVPFTLPAEFVDRAAWRVKRCGFRLVDAVPGVVDKRVPNPGIEGALWLKISVNAFNSTETGVGMLDEGVKCLYEMI